MKRLTLIASARIPGNDAELRLYEDGGHHSITLAGDGELMSTRRHASEDALATLACGRIAGRRQASVLIGGLGMGFTLAAALATLAADANVVVAELVPEVVHWNRGPLGRHAAEPLGDPRVDVRETDVALVLGTQAHAFDAILLDVDNGPAGLTRGANDWLYSAAGLAAALRALRPEGVLAVWSAHPDRSFAERLRRTGFAVEETTVRAHRGKGARHLIWLGTRTASAETGRT